MYDNDDVKALALGIPVVSFSLVITHSLGKLVGMNVFGLSDPVGMENIAAVLLGILILAAIIALVYVSHWIGEVIHSWLSQVRE